MKVKDLEDESGTSNRFLYCRSCGIECTANKGDYFLCDPNEELVCCEMPLVRVKKIVTYKEC